MEPRRASPQPQPRHVCGTGWSTSTAVTCFAGEATKLMPLIVRKLPSRMSQIDSGSLLANRLTCLGGMGVVTCTCTIRREHRGRRLGRALFRTEALFQHVLSPDVAVNVIRFRLFGLIPGQAVLLGAWRRSLDSAELLSLQRNGSRTLSPNTIAVDFESPRVQLGGVLNMQFGPSSRVGV